MLKRRDRVAPQGFQPSSLSRIARSLRLKTDAQAKCFSQKVRSRIQAASGTDSRFRRASRSARVNFHSKGAAISW